MKLQIQLLRPCAKAPVRMTDGSAGYDLFSAAEETYTIAPGETTLVPTGIAIAVPAGYGGFVFARSGLALKKGIAPGNCVGVIDSDYRGEVMVGLHNHGKSSVTLCPGDRIAQLVLLPVGLAEILVVEALGETDRADGGFGSTGR